MMKMIKVKKAVAAKITGALLLASTVLAGIMPVPVFAQSKEAVCICEEKCTDESINEECEVCSYDHNFCESEEAEPVEENYGPLTPEEAMENTGMVLEEFKPAQRKVIFEAADADLNLDHYLNPKFSASHMKFIMEQEMAGKDVTWLPIGKILHRSIVDKPLTRDQIRKIRERMQRAEQKDSVIAELKEKRKETEHVPKKQGHVKEKGER